LRIFSASAVSSDGVDEAAAGLSAASAAGRAETRENMDVGRLWERNVTGGESSCGGGGGDDMAAERATQGEVEQSPSGNSCGSPTFHTPAKSRAAADCACTGRRPLWLHARARASRALRFRPVSAESLNFQTSRSPPKFSSRSTHARPWNGPGRWILFCSANLRHRQMAPTFCPCTAARLSRSGRKRTSCVQVVSDGIAHDPLLARAADRAPAERMCRDKPTGTAAWAHIPVHAVLCRPPGLGLAMT
jgi:hypothetical protein